MISVLELANSFCLKILSALSFYIMIFLLNKAISGCWEEVRGFWFNGFIYFLNVMFIFNLKIYLFVHTHKKRHFWTPTFLKDHYLIIVIICFGSQCAVIIWIPCQLSSLHCIIKTSWENHGTWSSSWWTSFTWLSGASEFPQLILFPAHPALGD